MTRAVGDNVEHYVGEFEPNLHVNEYTMDDLIAPDGFFARGNYTGKIKLIDALQGGEVTHFKMEYAYEIAKDF